MNRGSNNMCKGANQWHKVTEKVLCKIAKWKTSKRTNKSAMLTATLQYESFVNGFFLEVILKAF